MARRYAVKAIAPIELHRADSLVSTAVDNVREVRRRQLSPGHLLPVVRRRAVLPGGCLRTSSAGIDSCRPGPRPANAAEPGPPQPFAQGAGGVVPSSARGAPGIGIAGFVLSLLGISVIGIVLSWVGYEQAKRESRPTGLCLAGIIVGAVWLALAGLAFLLFYVYPAL